MTNRIYKFRAWNKKSKSWMEPHMFSIDGNGKLLFSVVSGGDDYQHFDEYAKDIDILQFTGLLDKNGKEVWEGDLIRILERDWSSKLERDKRTIDEYMKDISSISEVVFNDGRFSLIQRKKGNYHSEYAGNTRLRDIFEIIGNIYEHRYLQKLAKR